MRTLEFWALADDDRDVVDRLAAGLGWAPARVLAYLLLRADVEDDPSTQLQIRIGTDLNRNAVTDALERLEDRDLVSRTTVRDDTPGRPPTAWTPVDGLDATVERTYRQHARRLLRQTSAVPGASVDLEDVGESATEPEGGRLVLGLNWLPNGLHVPFYAATLSGRYENSDVAVHIDHYEGSKRSIGSVVSGDADVGVAGAATVVRAREDGEPIVPIAVLYQRAMTVLYTTRDVFGEELESIEQLRGRRIGMPPESEMRVLGKLFLSQTDVAQDVQFVETAGEERRALLAGEADVVTGSFSDPRELAERGATVDSLLVADHFPIYGPVLIAREDTLADQYTLFVRFLVGTMHGWLEARRDGGSAVERIAAESGSTPERVRRTFGQAVEEFGGGDRVREHGWGWQCTEPWVRLGTALRQGGLFRGPT